MHSHAQNKSEPERTTAAAADDDSGSTPLGRLTTLKSGKMEEEYYEDEEDMSIKTEIRETPENFCEVNIEEEDGSAEGDYKEADQPQLPLPLSLAAQALPKLKLRNLKDIRGREKAEENGVLSDVDSATGITVSLDTWHGDCDFQVDRNNLAFSDKEKASDATYSPILDKLFCDVNKCFSVRFYIANAHYDVDDLTIRAMMVYTSTADLSVPVIRCPNHQSPADTINKTAYHKDQYDHVIWAAEPARYDRNLQSGRLSLVTSFGVPHVGSDYVTHVYKFTCIGSCSGGINRRPTSIVYTLEYDGRVVGRQTLSCRICSCPKRDRKQQEILHMKSNISQHIMEPSCIVESPPKKQKKMPTIHNGSGGGQVDSTRNVFMVPVWGFENYLAVSKFAEYLDAQSGAMDNIEYKDRRNQLILEQNGQVEDVSEENGKLVVIE